MFCYKHHTSNIMDKLFIIIPAYNEEENIEKCVAEWYPIIEQYNQSGGSKLVVINDGSKDNTYDILVDMAREKNLLVPLSKDNGGHGSTVLYGYNYALKEGADYIFQTDSDGQTNADEFHAFWDARNDYDAIIGNRIVRGDGKNRKLIENVVCLLLRLIFKVKVEDANAPFRLMKSELVAKYIKKLPENYNLPNIMFTTYFLYHKEKVKFEPITFKPRQGGTNSINIKKIIKIGWKAIGDFYKLKKEISQ